jgi:hypothetical protein
MEKPHFEFDMTKLDKPFEDSNSDSEKLDQILDL